MQAAADRLRGCVRPGEAEIKVVSPKLQDRPPIIYRLRSVPTIWAQTTFNPFEVSPYFEGKALFAFARRYMYYTPLQDESQSTEGGRIHEGEARPQAPDRHWQEQKSVPMAEQRDDVERVPGQALDHDPHP